MIAKKDAYTKSDVGEIEAETIVSVYGKETFFSLFAEQYQIFDLTYD